MARKPADVLAKSRKPQGREAVWAAIRALGLGSPFTVTDLARQTDVNRKTIRDYLGGLAVAGFVETGPVGMDGSHTFRLKTDCGVETPRVRSDGSGVVMGRGRENLWRTMRMVKEFTAASLAAQASTDDVQVSRIDAADYCRHLACAGYLVASGSGEKRTYRFLTAMYTGPKPPMVQRVKQVFDPNTGLVMWPLNRKEANHGR